MEEEPSEGSVEVSLRARALLLVLAAVMVALVTFGWISRTVVVAGFDELERADARERLERVAAALEADLESQLAVTRAQAQRPTTALLLRGLKPQAERVPPEELRSASLDALLYLDGLGRPMLEATAGRPLPVALERRLRDNTLRVSATGDPYVQGLVASEAGLAAFVSHQVRTPDEPLPVGTVISVRRIDEGYLQRLAERSFVRASLTVVEERGPRMVPVPFRPEGVHTHRDGDVVRASAYLGDPAGWYAVELTTDVPRAIAAAGREASQRLFLLILVTTLVVGAAVLVWFERRLLSRLARLTQLVAASDRDDRPVVELDGSDELAQLADRIEHTLTSLEMAQSALRQTNADLAVANRMKDDFVSMVSHEFRTPLTSIRGYAETLLRYAGRIDADKREGFTRRISVQTGVLERMVDDLLTLAQSREGTMRAFPEPVAVVDVVREALEALSTDAPVTVDVDPGLAVHADRDHLRRMIVNLVENAGKYGRPPVVVGARADGDAVEVRVRDHGDGVDARFAPALFDRFTQASVGVQRTAKGVGLGLSIVRTLAEANGGSVWYEPAGPGAAFGLRLPAASAVTTDGGTPRPSEGLGTLVDR